MATISALRSLNRLFVGNSSRTLGRTPPDTLRWAGVALLTLLLPGLGHLLVGQRRRGLFLLAITIVAMATAFLAFPRDPIDALRLVVQPRMLAAIFGINLLLAAFRLFAVVDLFRSSGILQDSPSSPGRLATGLLLAATLFLTAVPHVTVGYYDVVTYQLLDTIFDEPSGTRQVTTPPDSIEVSREINLKPGAELQAPPVTVEAVREDSS